MAEWWLMEQVYESWNLSFAGRSQWEASQCVPQTEPSQALATSHPPATEAVGALARTDEGKVLEFYRRNSWLFWDPHPQPGNCVSPIVAENKWPTFRRERVWEDLYSETAVTDGGQGWGPYWKQRIRTHSLGNRFDESSVKWPIPNYHWCQSNGESQHL